LAEWKYLSGQGNEKEVKSLRRHNLENAGRTVKGKKREKRREAKDGGWAMM